MIQTPLFSDSDAVAEVQKIACVGDSLTYGYELLFRNRNSYPAQLSHLLPDNYSVKNFGVNGACATPGQSDYYLNNDIQNIINWEPDIILLMLGSNDTKEFNWISREKYIEGMNHIIQKISSQKTKVILITPPPCHFNPFGIRDSVMRDEILPSLMHLSQENGLLLINIYDILARNENIYIDNIHLNSKGYSIMSAELAKYLMK